MREEYCPFTGKVAHPSENEARRALSHLKKSKDYNGHVFVCKRCGLFHIGRIGRRTDRDNLLKKKERKRYVKRTRSIITIFIADPPVGPDEVGLTDRESAKAPHLSGVHDVGEWQPGLSASLQSV